MSIENLPDFRDLLQVLDDAHTQAGGLWDCYQDECWGLTQTQRDEREEVAAAIEYAQEQIANAWETIQGIVSDLEKASAKAQA